MTHPERRSFGLFKLNQRPHDQTALTRSPFDLQPLLKVHGGGVVVD